MKDEGETIGARPAIVAKKPRNARELRDMLGCSGAFGRTLVGIQEIRLMTCSQGGLHMRNQQLIHAAQQVISTWDKQQEQGVDIVEWLNQMANAINQLREVVE